MSNSKENFLFLVFPKLVSTC